MRNRFRESRARLHRHRNQTLTAIILLHRGEAQARVCFRFCCLDARANSRKPPKACICTQIIRRILVFSLLEPDAQGRRRARSKHLAFVLVIHRKCYGASKTRGVVSARPRRDNTLDNGQGSVRPQFVASYFSSSVIRSNKLCSFFAVPAVK